MKCAHRTFIQSVAQPPLHSTFNTLPIVSRDFSTSVYMVMFLRDYSEVRQWQRSENLRLYLTVI